MQIATFFIYSKCHDNYSIKKRLLFPISSKLCTEKDSDKRELNFKSLLSACVGYYYHL